MAHLIDKSAIVAEIESLRRTSFTNFDEGVNATVQTLLETLDTLEVKEVDIEQLNKLLNWWKEVTTEHSVYKAKDVDLEKELIEWHKEHFKKDGTFIGKAGFYLTNNSQMELAKHFFELGLKAQKGE